MTNPDYMYNVFDRTRSMIDIPEIECITPIGKLVEPKSIEQLCFESASNIVKKAGTRKIVVTWSGGIDSTLALTELMKVAPHDQIVVMMNKNSVIEYPAFYNRFIKDKFSLTWMDFYTDTPLRNSLVDGVVVTGHLLDPVFGANIYQAIPVEKLNQNLKDFLNGVDIVSRQSYTRLIEACPRPLVNVKDFFWWMDYTLNYQSEQLMWLLEIEEMILDENLFHFGAGEDWNNYAVSTPAEVKWPGNNFNYYKMAIKEHVQKFTGDENYTRDKLKLPSWRKYRTDEQRWKNKAVWITTDWRRGWLSK